MLYLCFLERYSSYWLPWSPYWPWCCWLPDWPEPIAAPVAMPVLCLVCIWLTLCASQDLRRRQVSNWLTLPAAALALLYRAGSLSYAFVLLIGVVTALLGLLWRLGWVGGADLKASVALLLLEPGLLWWACCGVWAGYIGLRIWRGREIVHKFPAFAGFAFGAYSYLAVRWLYG